MKAQQSRTGLYILFFVVSILGFNTAFAQDNFEDTEIVNNVFKAFKKKKEKIILKSLPSKKDINYLIPLIEAGRPDEKIPEVDTIIANFETELSKNFKKILKKGSSFGVVWEKMVLTNVHYASNPDPNVEIERGNITLECESGDKKFRLILKKSYKVRDSWKLMNQINFYLL